MPISKTPISDNAYLKNAYLKKHLLYKMPTVEFKIFQKYLSYIFYTHIFFLVFMLNQG